MLPELALLALSLPTLIFAHACSPPLSTREMTHHNDPFWMESIPHRGIAPFHPDPNYKVFRNVKDFGAKGDGVTDDTAAINDAISSGGRCGQDCGESTTSPAVVYFPSGTYLVNSPLIALYYTQLIGDAKRLPTIRAGFNFTGLAVIDADPYIPGGGGSQYYVNQNNFFRSVRNFVIDLTGVNSTTATSGIHWQVSQATSLMNIVFRMSTANDTAHQGMFMENGSGGFMGDLVFEGGKVAMWVGNQQFTVRNVTIRNAQTAVFQAWNWVWTWQGLHIQNCSIGIDIKTGGTTAATQGVGAMTIIDAEIIDTPIFIRNSNASYGTLAGSLVLNNVALTNVTTAVGVANQTTPVLHGTHGPGTRTITSWAQGNVYAGMDGDGVFTQGRVFAPHKSPSLLDERGRIVGRTHPQYENHGVNDFVSVRAEGARGDGQTDDTEVLQRVLDQYAACKIIFVDAGMYIVTDTLRIPAGTRMVGEGWSVIAGTGPSFGDPRRPQVVVQVGAPGEEEGIMEITDIIFATVGPAPGAIVVEWNVKEPKGHKAGAGMWDSHIRLGGAAGTNLQLEQCPSNAAEVREECFAAFLALHLKECSTAYLEGTWVWLADHDLETPLGNQTSIYSGRGILSESKGPVWMIGTAEHHVLYQYNLVSAENHYMGLIQTESPYYQPIPAPPAPFKISSHYGDPEFPDDLDHSWAVNIDRSSNIIIFGAGLYSFFRNYTQTCLDTTSCQTQTFNVDLASSVWVYSLSTVGTTWQLSVYGDGVINATDNRNGFQQTATAWTREPGAQLHLGLGSSPYEDVFEDE